MYDPERHDRTRFAEPSVRRRYAVMERDILRELATVGRVLDLGCGTGRLTARLPARQVVGLDRERAMLRYARATRGITGVLGDVQAIPMADASFDALVSTDHVFHDVDQPRTLAECARVLAPRGRLIVHYGTDTIWSPRRPWTLTGKPHARGASGAGLVRLAAAQGLRLERARLWRWLRVYPYILPAPPWPALRLWNQGVFFFRKRG